LRKIGEEVNNLLTECHYKVKKEKLCANEDMQEYSSSIPPLKSVRHLKTDKAIKAVNCREMTHKATKEDKMAKVRTQFENCIETKDKEIKEALWEEYYKGEKKRKYFYRALLEKGHVTNIELQENDSRIIFAKLNKETRPKFQVVKRLNKALGLGNSYVGSNTEINRDQFIEKVKPIIHDKKVQGLYKYKIKEEWEAKDYSTIVNKIYSNWNVQLKG